MDAVGVLCNSDVSQYPFIGKFQIDYVQQNTDKSWKITSVSKTQRLELKKLFYVHWYRN